MLLDPEGLEPDLNIRFKKIWCKNHTRLIFTSDFMALRFT